MDGWAWGTYGAAHAEAAFERKEVDVMAWTTCPSPFPVVATR